MLSVFKVPSIELNLRTGITRNLKVAGAGADEQLGVAPLALDLNKAYSVSQ